METMNRRTTFRVAGIGGPVKIEHAYSVSGGAGGHGTRISTAAYAAGFDGNGGDSRDSLSEKLGIFNEKQAMQELNDRLATYMEQVKKLEEKNRWLEVSIREVTEKKGPWAGKDYSKYYAIIADLKAKKHEMLKDNAQLTLDFQNANLASKDYKLKIDIELSMRQMVDADVARLRKEVDDTNLHCLHLESEIEFLKEDLILQKKNHEADVAELRAQGTQVGVHVDVDAPKGQDISRVIEEMRDKYEKLIQNKKEEIKAWHESKVEKVQVQVTENTTALKEATGVLGGSKRTRQDLDIKLQTARKRNESLENALFEINARYGRELDEYKRLSETLEAEKNEMELNRRKYKLTTEQLQAEINEYKRLLEGLEGGGTLKLEDAVDSKAMVTGLLVVTQTVENGKVVSKDVKSIETVSPKK